MVGSWVSLKYILSVTTGAISELPDFHVKVRVKNSKELNINQSSITQSSTGSSPQTLLNFHSRQATFVLRLSRQSTYF